MQILFLLCNMVVVSSMMHYTIHYSFVLHTSTFVVQNWTPPVHCFFSVQTWTPPAHFFSTDLDSFSTLFSVQTWAHPVHFFQYRPGLLQSTFSVQTWALPVHRCACSTQLLVPAPKNTFPVLHTNTQASNTIFLQVQFAGGTIFLGVQSLN